MDTQVKLNFIEQLKANHRVSNLGFDADLLHEGWDDSNWFGGSLLWFTLDGKYDYCCIATGEIRMTYLPTDNDVVSKCDDYHRVREFFEECGIKNDTDMEKEVSAGNLYFGNNNWYQDTLCVKDGKPYVTDLLENADVSDGPFSWNNASELIEYLDEVIKDYEKE